MSVQGCAEAGGRIAGPSPDIAATAEVLRSLYLPGECRHLIELLLAAGHAGERPAPEAAGATGDAAFLDEVQALLAAEPNPRVGGERLRELRDALQIRTWFLDSLQDELRQCGARDGAAPLPDREALAARLRRQRARYEPGGEPAVSPAIRRQLHGG